MNNQFNEDLKRWLDTPKESRDYMLGAKLLLQLNRNQIMYRRITANIEKHKEDIDYQLQKHLKSRVIAATHQEVLAMGEEVEKIAISRGLKSEKPRFEFQKGKRADHDSLPIEIQSLYVENLSILQRMRAIHAELRVISDDTRGKFCPDSDRYPLLKELIVLDKKYRSNWHSYDTFNLASGSAGLELHPREESKKYLRLVNLNKGKYAKSPSEPLAAQIKDWYAKIVNPPAKLSKELADLGIL